MISTISNFRGSTGTLETPCLQERQVGSIFSRLFKGLSWRSVMAAYPNTHPNPIWGTDMTPFNLTPNCIIRSSISGILKRLVSSYLLTVQCFSTNCDALCRRFRTSTLRSAPYHTTNRLPLPLWSLLSKNYCMFGKGFLPSTILLCHHDQ